MICTTSATHLLLVLVMSRSITVFSHGGVHMWDTIGDITFRADCYLRNYRAKEIISIHCWFMWYKPPSVPKDLDRVSAPPSLGSAAEEVLSQVTDNIHLEWRSHPWTIYSSLIMEGRWWPHSIVKIVWFLHKFVALTVYNMTRRGGNP